MHDRLIVTAGSDASSSASPRPAGGDDGPHVLAKPSVVGATFEALQREIAFRTEPEPRVRRCWCRSRPARLAREAEQQRRLRAVGVAEAVLRLCVFSGNYVQTNKYTLLSFPFKALQLQFQQVANVYFLFIGVFYAWERVSPVTGGAAMAPAPAAALVCQRPF